MSILRKKHLLVPTALAVVGLVAVLVFWRPLAAWFGLSGANAAVHNHAHEASAPQGLPPSARSQLTRAFDGYEQVRALLASDSIEGLAGVAQELAQSLESTRAELGDTAHATGEQLTLGSAAAVKLRDAADVQTARDAFAEVSQSLIALASLDPELQDGWRIFQCPMTNGFGKWFQRSDKMGNPYMGKKMLACGTRSAWEVEGLQLAAGADAHEVAHYTCPMHPSVKQASPGQCPMCGMDLVPVTKGELHSGVIIVDDARRQRIGVKTAQVTREPLDLAIRALGRITWDETRLEDVTLRVKGWIKDLRVSATGVPVRKGQVLFSLYSPELYSAQQEFLLAKRSAGEHGDPTLLEASRRRLRLWGVSEAQIDVIAEKGEPLEHVPFLSPASGYVIEKDVVEGAAVEPGMKLFRIVPLDRVWVEADVYEADLPHVKVGQTATVTLPFLPGRKFEGKVKYVYPYLEGATRTGKIRLELPNQDLELKPDMYADITFHRDLGERLLVPASAVIYTGPRRIVFIDLGEGRFKPQEVQLGVRGADAFEVLGGLNEGDVVVTSGNFLIAAESRLRSSADFWSGGEE
ncbi:MAG: efflux RND transporter periplasmic adaptor subunit [Myxococcaceae bacterium]